MVRVLGSAALPAHLDGLAAAIARLPAGHPARISFGASYARIALRSERLRDARAYITAYLAHSPADTEIPSPQLLLVRALQAAIEGLDGDAGARARLEGIAAELVRHGYEDTDARIARR